MSCVKVKSLAGREREICDGKVVPMFSDARPATKETRSLFAQLDKEIGPGFGDKIKAVAAPIAEFYGKTGCSGCEARRLTANAANQLIEKHGWLPTLQIMKQLLHLSVKDPSSVPEKLREYL